MVFSNRSHVLDSVSISSGFGFLAGFAMAKKKLILGESGLPTAADNPEIDYHATDDCLVVMWYLGSISVEWNYCEHFLSTLIWPHFDNFEKGLAVTSNLGNRSRADLLLSLARKFERSKRIVERIEFATKVFNRLRETRNILMHSHSIGSHNKSGKLEWLRTSATAPLGHVGTLADIYDLDRISTDIRRLTGFLMQISFYYLDKQNGRKPRALPKIYSLPDKLTQLPPEARPKPRRPPRSSRA